MEFLHHPAFWIVVGAGSEIIALLPIRDNSWVQLLFHALYALKPGKR